MSKLSPFPRLLDSACASPTPVVEPMPIAAAYERVRVEIASVPDDALAVVNVDVQAAVHTVRVALPALLELRPTFARELPTFDLAMLDKLSDYAEALAFLHTELKRSDKPEVNLPAMYAEAVTFRESVVAVGRSLVLLELMDTRVFEQAGRVIGYTNVAYELIGLCSTMLENLPRLGGRCPLTEEQLRRGQALANLILSEQAEKSRASSRYDLAQRNRQRAYTLLARAWVHIRRAVIYLRWAEGDADTLAPSFYPGRGASRRGESADRVEASASDAGPSAESVGSVAARAVADGGPSLPPMPFDPPKGDPLFTPLSDEPFVRV